MRKGRGASGLSQQRGEGLRYFYVSSHVLFMGRYVCGREFPLPSGLSWIHRSLLRFQKSPSLREKWTKPVRSCLECGEMAQTRSATPGRGHSGHLHSDFKVWEEGEEKYESIL